MSEPKDVKRRCVCFNIRGLTQTEKCGMIYLINYRPFFENIVRKQYQGGFFDMYINPYENLSDAVWRKANFHTHSGTGPKSCGFRSPEVVVDLYREYKYELLSISNHNLYRSFENYSDDQITLIDGVEYTSDIHMLTVGVKENLISLPVQEAITRTNELGGFVILCHPNWPDKAHFHRK